MEATTLKIEEVEELFISKVGNAPNDMFQFLNFCKQENIPFKYKEIKIWWNKNKVNDDIPQIPDNLKHRAVCRYSHNKYKSKLLSNNSKFVNILKTEANIYKLLVSKYHDLVFNHKDNDAFINKMMQRYEWFLNKLIKLKDEEKINNYLQKHCSLHPHIQFLWRLHLIHHIEYKNHCHKLFDFVVYPTYAHINFHDIIKENNDDNKDKPYKHKHPSIVIKQIFDSMSFKSKIKSYLIFMNKVLIMLNGNMDIIHKHMIVEYKEYIQFLAQSKYLHPNLTASEYNWYTSTQVRPRDVLEKRIINLSHFLPTVTQSFVWCTHILFGRTFHQEIGKKLHKYKQYTFFDLHRVSAQNNYRSDVLWKTIRDETVQHFEKDNLLESLVEKQNAEFAICGFMDVKSMTRKYLVPLDVIRLISEFYTVDTSETRKTNYYFERIPNHIDTEHNKERLRYYEQRRHLQQYAWTGRYIRYGATTVREYKDAYRFHHYSLLAPFGGFATPLYG